MTYKPSYLMLTFALVLQTKCWLLALDLPNADDLVCELFQLMLDNIRCAPCPCWKIIVRDLVSV
jgi:hypothetical protein